MHPKRHKQLRKSNRRMVSVICGGNEANDKSIKSIDQIRFELNVAIDLK